MSAGVRIPRDMCPLAERARAQGWPVAWCPGGHLRWSSPAGALVYSSGSPSDWRAVHKLRADLRRHGLCAARA